PLPLEGSEVAAEVLAPQPAWLVVELAQPVADAPDARVDLVLHDRPTAVRVALEHADGADRALPFRQPLVVREGIEARLRGRADVRGAALAVGRHQAAPPHRRRAVTAW